MKLDLADARDMYNFRRGDPVHLAMLSNGGIVKARPPSWLRRAWRRLTCWRRRPTFQIVTRVDVDSGSIEVASVPGRWSWLRWAWIARLP